VQSVVDTVPLFSAILTWAESSIQQEALTATYPSLDELKAELKARGLPIDHLEDPKLIELEPSDE
jgi:hypothetical protein